MNEYDRYLSPLDVLAIAFGCAIGWGAFSMPGTTFLPVAGPIGTVIAMVIGMAAMLIIGGNFSFLMKNNPGTGGVYAYTKDALGRDHAFLCAWFLCLSYLTIVFLNATSLFTVIRMMFGRSLQVGFYYYHIAGNVIFMGEVGASIVALAIVGMLFINAKPLLQTLHTIMAVVLLVCVLIVAGFCLPHLGSLQPAFGTQGGNRLHALFSIVMSGLVYILLTLVSTCATPDGYASWSAYIADLGALDGVASIPVFYVAKAIMGDVGLFIVAVAAIAAILTGMIAAYRATARILSTMAEDRILSEKFSNTTYSILTIMVISIVISIFGRNALNCFISLTSFGAIVAFGYSSASAWKVAREVGNRKIIVTGAIGTVISAVLLIVQLIPKLSALETMGSEAFLVLSLWCLLGFVFYLRTVARAGVSTGTSASSVVMFALLLYSVLMWLGKRLMAANSLQAVRDILHFEGSLMMLVIFIGLCVMMLIQRLMRKKHEMYERLNAERQEEEDGE